MCVCVCVFISSAVYYYCKWWRSVRHVISFQHLWIRRYFPLSSSRVCTHKYTSPLHTTTSSLIDLSKYSPEKSHKLFHLCTLILPHNRSSKPHPPPCVWWTRPGGCTVSPTPSRSSPVDVLLWHQTAPCPLIRGGVSCCYLPLAQMMPTKTFYVRKTRFHGWPVADTNMGFIVLWWLWLWYTHYFIY